MALQELSGVFVSGTAPNSTSPPKPSFVSSYIERFSADQSSWVPTSQKFQNYERQLSLNSQ